MPLTTTLAGGSALIKWLLRDEFAGTLAGGAVNGTPATPGPGTRTLTDTGNNISIGSGAMTIAAGASWGDPLIYWGAESNISRTVGRLALFDVTWAAKAACYIGYDTVFPPVGTLLENAFYTTAATLSARDSAFIVVDNYSATTKYQWAIVLRAAGAYFWIKGGAFSEWTLQWIGSTSVSDPVGLGMTVNTATLAVDFVRVPDELYIPTPLAYDSFTRANGALGSTEATGPDGQTAPVKVWQSGGATWTIAGNEAINTPTEGADLLTNSSFAGWTADNPDGWGVTGEVGNDPEVSEAAAGESHVDTPTLGGGHANLYNSATAGAPYISQTVLTIGNWYTVETDIDTFTAGNVVVKDASSGITSIYTTTGVKVTTGRAKSALFLVACVAANSDVTIDSISIKQLTLNTLFSNVETGTVDVVCQVELDTIVAGTQAGLVLNLDDKDTPANFVIAYHNGAQCRLEKCVAGTYTTVITAATVYAAGATLVVIKEGTAYSLYYNNAKVGATSTVSDAGIIDNTLHGMFNTYSGNQLDNFLCMPRGTNGEYGALDRYSS